MNQVTFIILGATGDLCKRKLIPAIYKLIENNKLDRFAFIGVSFDKTDINTILENSEKFISKIDKNIWNKLKNASYYYQLDFYDNTSYHELKNLIKHVETKHEINGNKLFYLATMPEHFKVITKNLNDHKIITKYNHENNCSECKHPWSRIVYEKPFGHDLKSAKEINRCIEKSFHENQIYRIDHYLGKELVSNIALVRFTNRIFEPLWNNKNIDSVQIILKEKIGIEGRGAFYDKYGAIKDVLQNHMLQILSLIAMEQPKKLEAKYIRDAKAKVLKNIKFKNAILGQYEGYTQEHGVNPNSKTETFAALKLEINNKRWKNVPFYLKTGKHLNEKETSIHIKFKMVKCLLTQGCPTDSNYLTLKINPDQGFYLELNSKDPKSANNVVPVQMNFCHSCLLGPNTPEAYEYLILDVIKGDQSAFVRSDEIEYSWKIIDQMNKNKFKIFNYPKNSSGPKELKLLDKKIIRWRS
ncbi:glucose-6-phosphate dehydrogenase [Candidatus Dependentiae bacterium]|nr:glucose-6-phosphate dehydrogenase [Candidatus Dependentiae bacterium]MBU4387683.1 glucose-6-phosphate dehydrogenase [Candidatus Dependentiae bacterium]MCG2756613.1 glucose-6-phosphate dehydrogenase [Candidatus Dependentiae bacterium]